MTPRRTKGKAPTSESPKRLPKADQGVYPHQLRSGDVITDEQGVELELLSQPMKVVGVQEFTATPRRPDRPAEIHEARWRTHERVKVRRPA